MGGSVRGKCHEAVPEDSGKDQRNGSVTQIKSRACLGASVRWHCQAQDRWAVSGAVPRVRVKGAVSGAVHGSSVRVGVRAQCQGVVTGGSAKQWCQEPVSGDNSRASVSRHREGAIVRGQQPVLEQQIVCASGFSVWVKRLTLKNVIKHCFIYVALSGFVVKERSVNMYHHIVPANSKNYIA